MSKFIPYHWPLNDHAPLAEHERVAVGSGLRLLAGVDEAGRGPLAGPIVAGAVMLAGPIEGVNDSKQLSEKKREILYAAICDGTHAVGITVIEATMIDSMGLQQANYAAMVQAAEQLVPAPQLLLVDGFTIRGCPFEQKKLIKGDQLSQSIAAASIVAKVTRDRIMVELDSAYPEYGFARHKGYGTKAHLEAIHQYGPCPAHRRSFAPIAQAIESGTLFKY